MVQSFFCRSIPLLVNTSVGQPAEFRLGLNTSLLDSDLTVAGCITPLPGTCRKPSLLVHIRDESPGPAVPAEAADQGLSTGEVNEALMQMLLQQGRLTLEQVIAAAAQHLEQPVDQSRELLQRHFIGLVQVSCSAPLALPVFLPPGFCLQSLKPASQLMF